ncbi:hypothetical protein Taro_055808 [Colocasia esculenta]|uniref:Uncharacterized protein n=1 Tax=Colocasia esculenta TaxID=4460 RepID=A0A843XUM2_COLES|nr:hypothetical protein [Colocasia esculenta]
MERWSMSRECVENYGPSCLECSKAEGSNNDVVTRRTDALIRSRRTVRSCSAEPAIGVEPGKVATSRPVAFRTRRTAMSRPPLRS